VKCPINTDNARHIIEKARKDLLRERVRVINNRIDGLEVEVQHKQGLIRSVLTEERANVVCERAHTLGVAAGNRSKAQQNKKLDLLKKRSSHEVDLSGTQLKRWVVNLSKYKLKKNEEKVLAKGLNFAISPAKIPIDDYIIATETACSKIDKQSADHLRAQVTGLLNNRNPPKSNISNEERAAITTLQKNKSIMVLPADKGRATVLLDTVVYEEKVKGMLADGKTYGKLTKNPTAQYKRKLIELLTKLKENNKINYSQYTFLYPTTELVPRIYCTPKIHKPGAPLRPIVDYTGSICYNLSRSLADLLSPLVGKTPHHVQNSKDLAECMQHVVLDEEDIFLSHDVVSLFTNTPIEEAIEIIHQRLVQDKTLKDRTFLDPQDITELLRFVLTTTYFTFRGEIYEQKYGAAMGSPVSPIVANLFMEHLEQTAIATCPLSCKPKLWKRYVDDVLEIVKKGQEQNLTEHINSIDKTGSIKFTFEEEKDNSIAFLDTMIMKRPDNSVKLIVYRKKTHTDQYLHFDSHHPLHQKLGVIRTLNDRAETIITEEDDKRSEKQHIQKALQNVGYKSWTFNKVNKDKIKKLDENEKRKHDKERCKGMVTIPYVKGLSEAFDRVCRSKNIAVAMKPHNTLRQMLVRPKDKRAKEEQSGVVYEISCKNCEQVYVGETGRSLGCRLKEHKADGRKVENIKYTRSNRKESETTIHKSALTDHAAQHNHIINWEEAKILDKQPDKQKLRISEAIWIRRRGRQAINRDEGAAELSGAYNPLIEC